MRRFALPCLFAVLVVPGTASLAAQAKLTPAQKIANAVRAAPASITGKAMIMDWPAAEGGPMTSLRAGTNGWTCLPDFPMTEGDDPMCLDDQWMSFMQALMTKATPQVARLGFGYMTAPGGSYGSNTDPYATAKTADNEWGFDPPHLMLLVSNPRELQGLPTKRENGGPWVMFPGTAYAHVMVPLSSTGK